MIIEAKDFAGPKVSGRHHFGGASREQTIAALERLIEGVRDGRVLIQKAVVSSEMDLAEWTLSSFTLTYAEQDEPFPPEYWEQKARAESADFKELYGGDAKLPVEIRRA